MVIMISASLHIDKASVVHCGWEDREKRTEQEVLERLLYGNINYVYE